LIEDADLAKKLSQLLAAHDQLHKAIALKWGILAAYGF
jgi:hypothetical protein